MSPTFNYRVNTEEGKTEKGKLESSSRKEAAWELKKQGYFIAELEQIDEPEKEEEESKKLWEREIDLSWIAFWREGLNTEELAQFSEQFSVLISAGIPLMDALDIIREQTHRSRFERVLDEVISEIEGGTTFSEALTEHKKYFPSFFCQMVKAGETGGVLDEVLNQLSDHYRRQHELKEEVKSALYYPLTVLFVAVTAIIFILTFVVPEIIGIFAAMDIALPTPTLILITMSDFLQNFWWLLLSGFIAVILVVVLLYRNPKGRWFFDSLLLRLPVVGGLIIKLGVSRFASTLALLLDSGVTLINALPVVEGVVDNKVVEKSLINARGRLREGVNISKPLDDSDIFPPMVVQMIEVGEETGNLGKMLKKLSGYYEMEARNTIDGAVSMLEPALIVFLAVSVGFIGLAVILPMFEMYASI